eukprot:TRINITY_DN22336_c0_g1_i1.p1 TRINITY_DN22336_c0_g1~~TRINITY_DN22336_c0_g1_i1.p1  ORF type:complete len:415 (+),score=87.56 TRINITY_DN22336_c0_g1_i1:174-1418(+)
MATASWTHARLATTGALADAKANGLGELDMHAKVDKVLELLLYEDRYKEHAKRYEPLSWRDTVFALRGRPTLGHVYWGYCLFIIILVSTCELAKDTDEGSFLYKPVTFIRALPSSPVKIMASGLLFLAAFRTQTSFQKWNQARQVWMNLTNHSRDLAMQSCTYFRDYDSCSRLCRYTIVYVIAVRFWFRGEDLSRDVIKHLLSSAGLAYICEVTNTTSEMKGEALAHRLSYQYKFCCAPLAILEILREILDDAVEMKHIGPFHMALENSMKALGAALANGERLLNTLMPFAYVSHLRTTLLAFLFVMPFFLIMELGWLTIPTVLFFGYVIFGLENLAVEIENPFGYDANDLPMDTYIAEIARDIRDILSRRRNRHVAQTTEPQEEEGLEDDGECGDEGDADGGGGGGDGDADAE